MRATVMAMLLLTMEVTMEATGTLARGLLMLRLMLTVAMDMVAMEATEDMEDMDMEDTGDPTTVRCQQFVRVLDSND